MENRVHTCSTPVDLPLRYGGIRAVVAPRIAESGAQSRAAHAETYFRRRGLPVSAEARVERGELVVIGAYEPSRYGLFREVLSDWANQTGFRVAHVEEKAAPGPRAEQGGYRSAWERDEQYQQWLDRVWRDLGFQSPAGEGARWAQVTEGAWGDVSALESAFHTLRLNGRVSRFPNRGITVARQATCAPYGLPAVLLKLKGTCRLFAERVGMCLLEANPRVVAMSEVAPGVVLVENTPPLDHIWTEGRFWTAWQSLPETAWKDIVACAAVRVLRYVEVNGHAWEFYDQAYSPRDVVDIGVDLAATPEMLGVGEHKELAEWRRRRCCEIALALQTESCPDHGLSRHAIGSLAIPYPFLHPIPPATAIPRVETYLAKAAATLHAQLICAEGQDLDLATREHQLQLEVIARQGLQRIQHDLLP